MSSIEGTSLKAGISSEDGTIREPFFDPLWRLIRLMSKKSVTAPIVKSLNIGLPVKEVFHGRETVTGICKKPVNKSVRLTASGLQGDGVADEKNHGGVDKAVCVYSLDHYPYWERILGVTLTPAAFGENLSVSPLYEDEICIGDKFGLGTSIVQVSQPRQPCKTLAARFGRRDMVKLVLDSGFTGFYCRVMKEGNVKRGDRMILQEKDHNGISVSFASRVYHHESRNYQAVDRILKVEALSASWQQSLKMLMNKSRLSHE
jgi:MOSC domain-containing protein YiiM